MSVAGLTNGFGGVSSEQELDGAPGRKATPRRRCVSESSICSISSPLCDTRWAPARPPTGLRHPRARVHSDLGVLSMSHVDRFCRI